MCFLATEGIIRLHIVALVELMQRSALPSLQPPSETLLKRPDHDVGDDINLPPTVRKAERRQVTKVLPLSDTKLVIP
jgi:hypothetical protein